MRFAAIADVHGNYLALEAVLADIRAQGVSDIVNLGDMLSGPLDARRTIEILMKLDACTCSAIMTAICSTVLRRRWARGIVRPMPRSMPSNSNGCARSR